MLLNKACVGELLNISLRWSSASRVKQDSSLRTRLCHFAKNMGIVRLIVQYYQPVSPILTIRPLSKSSSCLKCLQMHRSGFIGRVAGELRNVGVQ
ncbi:hypothetical protein NPIL_630161 [Nephila pilipes]|uniref:Uncharacterized protein n=1 Tax=Nephila pilipes TaxID=299642 RepID=A0A8X6R217_NEPPI|nr:hypothetical protein NPIL_630161 [Nephila pilipes]